MLFIPLVRISLECWYHLLAPRKLAVAIHLTPEILPCGDAMPNNSSIMMPRENQYEVDQGKPWLSMHLNLPLKRVVSGPPKETRWQ
jgi:hypothetical protein